jgi:hypothetical protein
MDMRDNESNTLVLCNGRILKSQSNSERVPF